jgi:hypothetical protein
MKLSRMTAKSKINIQLEKFYNEGINPLEKIIEERREKGVDVKDLEYRLSVYNELYNQTQRLVYSHAFFIYHINKFHNTCKQIGLIKDNTISFDCLEEDVDEAYKYVTAMINFYKQNEQQFTNQDEVVDFIKRLQEECGGIKFED